VTRTILVADDNRHLVRTMVDLLRLQGWEAAGAYSGEEAIEAVRMRRYDVLVMDVRMNGMNGVEALRAIRAFSPRLPVILMTAYSATELLREAERLGALRILPKPFPITELVAILESALRKEPSVLVVDDDQEFLRTLCGVLISREIPCLQAATLEEALGLIEREHPGVVLLDLKLQEGQPQDAVLAIRRLSPAVALILCSGHSELLETTTAAFPQQWFSACLRKPFLPEKLIEIIHALAGR
jgi:two-component system response regulator HydG